MIVICQVSLIIVPFVATNLICCVFTFWEIYFCARRVLLTSTGKFWLRFASATFDCLGHGRDLTKTAYFLLFR